MITAERKPFTEIKEMIAPYRKVLVVGCGSCVAECAAGGEKEVGLLASELRMDAKISGKDLEFKEITIDRQCVYEFIDLLTDTIDEYDIVLSLGCGAGVQAVAYVFPKVNIVPALNTKFIGETKEAGLWIENCRACGDDANWGCSLQSVLSPVAQRDCSTAHAVVPEPNVARLILMFLAPGNLSSQDSMRWEGSISFEKCSLRLIGQSSRGRDRGKSTGRIRGHEYRKQSQKGS